MGQIDNLSQGEFPGIFRRLRALEFATNQNNMAIGRGGLSVYGGGGITIENGGLYVNGSATIIGTLNADGTINMTGVFVATGDVSLNGPTDVTGDFTVTGPTELNGETDIGGNTSVTGDLDVEGPLEVTGTMDIKGKSTLQNDLEVKGGGKIKAGGVTIDPSRFNGGVVFDNGPYVAATPNGAQLAHPSGGAMTVSSGQADMGVAGGGAVLVNKSGVALTGIPTTTEKSNVYIDASGRLWRSTAN